jgi:3-phenylpropionate/cinnamic acid dioxygenase small subunit
MDIDLSSPTTAHALSDYVMFDADDKEDWHVQSWGRYIDDFVKVDGRWLFARRQLVKEARERKPSLKGAGMTEEEKIRKTMAMFCHALDDRRFQDWANTFEVNGAFGTRAKSRAEILEWISGAELATVPELSRKHSVSNIVLEVKGDVCEATSDLVMYDKYPDKPWTIRVGKYSDTLARQADGQWLFRQRNLEWKD